MKKLWNRKTVLNNVVDLLSHFKSTLIERMISRTSKKKAIKKSLNHIICHNRTQLRTLRSLGLWRWEAERNVATSHLKNSKKNNKPPCFYLPLYFQARHHDGKTNDICKMDLMFTSGSCGTITSLYPLRRLVSRYKPHLVSSNLEWFLQFSYHKLTEQNLPYGAHSKSYYLIIKHLEGQKIPNSIRLQFI